MSDDDKTKTDEVAEEVAEEKETEEKPTEEPEAQEPKADEQTPAEDASSPTANAAEPAGTDQQGRQLYNVKCSNCGRDTQVPFKPSGDRPVYCRDCYMQKKNS